jgi:hypothetical protein
MQGVLNGSGLLAVDMFCSPLGPPGAVCACHTAMLWLDAVLSTLGLVWMHVMQCHGGLSPASCHRLQCTFVCTPLLTYGCWGLWQL